MRGKDASDSGEGGLRAFLDGGAMDRAEAALRRRLGDRPDDPALVRDLAQVLRQKGDLDGAAAAYRQLSRLAPNDALAARMAALLDGAASPPSDPIPARFFLARGFLPPERLEEVREHVRSHRMWFGATEVRTDDGEQRHEMETRRSASCTEVGAIRDWFDGLLLARFRDIVVRTGLEPFEPRILSCKITAWHDGCFFHLHQDRATGVATTRRLGFLFYFDFAPRRFRGGELLLCWHEVLPVRCESDDRYAARFTFGGRIHDAALMEGGEEGE